MKESLEADKALFEEVLNKLKRLNSNANKDLVDRVQTRLDRVNKLLESFS